MTLSRIVFHCTDQDLFGLFIRRLPRHVLVTPLRNDQVLQTRYFRGYRISSSRPDVAAISRAYYKEINTEHNRELMDYLCGNWIMAHDELATRTLECLASPMWTFGVTRNGLLRSMIRLRTRAIWMQLQKLRVRWPWTTLSKIFLRFFLSSASILKNNRPCACVLKESFGRFTTTLVISRPR